MTRTSFHDGWYVGLIVRVVLCSVSACESLDAFAKEEAVCGGAVSILAMILLASEEAEGWVDAIQSQHMK